MSTNLISEIKFIKNSSNEVRAPEFTSITRVLQYHVIEQTEKTEKYINFCNNLKKL